MSWKFLSFFLSFFSLRARLIQTPGNTDTQDVPLVSVLTGFHRIFVLFSRHFCNIYRGYYIPASGYEFCLRVQLDISYLVKINEGCRIFPSNLRRCFDRIEINLGSVTQQLNLVNLIVDMTSLISSHVKISNLSSHVKISCFQSKRNHCNSLKLI